MTNYFRREPFTTLATGECESCGAKAYRRVFLPRVEPMTLCDACAAEILEAWND